MSEHLKNQHENYEKIDDKSFEKLEKHAAEKRENAAELAKDNSGEIDNILKKIEKEAIKRHCSRLWSLLAPPANHPDIQSDNSKCPKKATSASARF